MQFWVHHLNDMSGSPLILAERLKGLPENSEVTLITNQSDGFLSEWNGLKETIPYTKHSGKILRFLSLTRWYFTTFFYLLANARKGDTLILSTLISSPLIVLRFFVFLEVVQISVNEVFFRVPIWRALGLFLVRSNAVEKIYLSHYVKDAWDFGGDFTIEYPKIRQSLIDLSENKKRIKKIDPNALSFFLVGSYIEAKGYKLFIELARHFEASDKDHTFSLYLSGSNEKFDLEFPNGSLPKNLQVTFNNSSPKIFDEHDVFLGLTNIDLWIETFGQTFAEAMMMENIVILPHVGAQLEYVKDGKNAFLFTNYSLDGVLVQIERVLRLENHNDFAMNTRRSVIDFYLD